MPATVSVNGRTVVHKKSDGTSIAGPDVCKTQCGSAVVPIPYPNIAKSSDLADGATSVTADGQPLGHEKSNFSTSSGDEAGGLKGVASGTNKGIAEFVNCSFDVSVEGKGVVRAFEPMIHNSKNTPPTVLLQPPQVLTFVDEEPEVPEQDKVEMIFLDPFGEPIKGMTLEVDIDGKKEIMTTGSRGQITHVTDKDNVTLAVKNKNMDFREKE